MLRISTIFKLVFIGSLVILTGCQSSNVVVDYDTSADFSNLRHYQLQPQKANDKDFDPLLDERTRKALQAELSKEGLIEETAEQAANIIVSYHVSSQIKDKPSETGASIGLGGSSSGNTAMGLALSFPLGGDKVVKEIQIVIDMLNPSDKTLKWRATKNLTVGDESPEQITAIMNAAIEEIFTFYPPGTKAN
ncbi:DUF4136 domain-containing protein [Oceanicoccus sp. KOV_DT_Chl]|uniref:DUF4136 domain-containing protein n=1 Tax=Oceanicoccus sp. KOV_DT_Chl TaxID=1904639 RepID=UPI000C7C447E|nr:DUF4136 domain-containing protein [Oceanicoccus sp. KOV_DT_Chl]